MPIKMQLYIVSYMHCSLILNTPIALSIAAISENFIAISSLAFHAVELLDFHSLKLHYYMHWNKVNMS